jgi:hypothetical protein
MNITRLCGALLAVALPFALTGVATGTASASPMTAFTLTVAALEGPADTVELECEPTGGSHPHARRACAELFAARGKFENLPGELEHTSCTMEYRPVVAIAEGTWRGEHVEWEQEFSNGCTLRAATGSVFRF